jgi:hypothetical protein
MDHFGSPAHASTSVITSHVGGGAGLGGSTPSSHLSHHHSIGGPGSLMMPGSAGGPASVFGAGNPGSVSGAWICEVRRSGGIAMSLPDTRKSRANGIDGEYWQHSND